jgi:ADP-ribose pyrophosphatase YjhB (NUDIX family)
MSDPRWLLWARKLQAISQAGLTYCEDPVDRARFEEVRAVAAEITASHSNLTVEEALVLFDRDTGYATPKIAVRAVVFDEGRILLVRERDGLWSMPGGYADVDESPSEATARETLEESGYLVRPARLLAVYDRSKQGPRTNRSGRFHNFYTMFFDCELIERAGEASPLETTAAEFFPIDALPPLRVPWMAEQIPHLWTLHEHPQMPTEFD